MADAWKVPSEKPSLDVITLASGLVQASMTWANRAKWFRIANVASIVVTIGALFLPGDASLVLFLAGFVSLFVTKWLHSRAFKKGAKFYEEAKAVVTTADYHAAALYAQRAHGDEGPIMLHRMMAES